MKATWKRIADWFDRVDEYEVMLNLFGGASPETLANLEQRIGVALHDHHRALLGIHDGTEHQRIIWGEELLSADDVAHSYGLLSDWLGGGEFAGTQVRASGPVAAVWWHPSWVPLSYDGAGNYHMVDMAPAAGGSPGQIVRYLHREPERRVVAPSLHDWLNALADDLCAGHWQVERDNLVRV